MTACPFYQIDAFAEGPLKGNPAAIMPSHGFPDADLMQAIAAENNLAETAFLVRTGETSWDLRWFTPAIEVDLCGHATLAAAHVLFAHEGFEGPQIDFDTRSGRLTVRRMGDGRLEMDFPATMPQQIETPASLASILGASPIECWAAQYMIAIFENADQIRALAPDLARIGPLVAQVTGDRGDLVCAAPGDNGFDVVSRFFAPAAGIDEDPATGSAHCQLAPLFAQKLGKDELDCFQAFPGRGGVIGAKMAGDRVKLRGRAVTIIEGVFHL